jgi:nucleoside-diphosphate-sugar epimerase
MSQAKRVFVTCVGSGVGQSVVDSLKHRKEDYFIVGSDRSPYCYPLPDCDDFVRLPPIDDTRYVEAVVQACAERRIDAAIPGHDLELALFARDRARFEAAGVAPLVASEPLVRLLRDKRAWSEEFGSRTRRIVPCCHARDLPQRVASGAIRLPAIAKPVSGSASAGLRIIHRVEDAQGLAEDVVIQPFLFPTQEDAEYSAIRAAVDAGRVIQASEISVQLAYSRDSRLLGKFASRNRLKAGVPVEFHTVDDPGIWSAVDEVRAVLESYEPRGPINLQGRVTDRGLVFFEMNPRFTGITGNRAQLGFNEVALLVDNFVTGEVRALPINHHKVGVRQVACRAWPRERFAFGRDSGRTPGPRAIVVLGGTSWLARHFAAERARRGDTVVVVCRPESVGRATDLYAAKSVVHVLSHDSRELPDRLASADVVVNCMSARPPHGATAIVEAHLRQMRLLDVLDTAEVPYVVNVSSQSVYGAGRAGRHEAAPVEASEPYAFSKLAIEESIRGMTRRKPSLAAVSLRFARLFGAAEGMRAGEFAHRVVDSAVHDRELEVRSPRTSLDLIDLRDAVRALSFFVDVHNPHHRGDVYNVGTGASVTVADYVALADRLCRQRFARPLRVSLHDSAGDSQAPMSCERIASAGWTPAYSLERSVADLYEYFARAS